MASHLGATLHALVSLRGPISDDDEDRWVPMLGQGGADKVILVPGSEHRGPALWPVAGPALCAACARLLPNLVIFAATHSSRDIAPRLAAHTRAAYLAEPAVEYGPGAALALVPAVRSAGAPGLALHEHHGPVVITLPPGAHQPASGYDEAETMYMAPPRPGGPGLEYMDSSDDPGAALDHARVIVVAGGGVSSRESYALVAELARALGGELAATPTLCERGLAPADRAIGVGHRHVAPALYVVCAASGSRHHLDAVRPGATIIAIDRDPDAPVFGAAHYALVGELETVVPALITALGERNARPAVASS